MQDYRLVFPAVIVWTIAIIGSVDYVALGVVGVLALLAGLLDSRWFLIAAGAALVAATVSGSAHQWLRESDALTRLTKSASEVTIHATIDSHPRDRGGTFSANAKVTHVTADGITQTSSQSARVTWDKAALCGNDTGRLETCSGDDLARGAKFAGTGLLAPLPEDFAAVANIDMTEVQLLSHPGVTNTIRGSLRAAVEERPWHAELIPGVVVGDDTGLPDHVVEDMRILGLSHLTAVSGAHISLVIAIMLAAIGRRRPLIAGVLCLVALGGLIQLVGPEASVLRAGYMGILICLAVAIRRCTTAIPILCLVVIVVSLMDLELARSLGFQLSAVATGAIIIFSHPLTARLRPYLPEALAEVVSISLVAAIATGPLLFAIQDRASLWSAAANALVAPVVAPLTILGMAGALLLPLVPWIALPILGACELFTAWMAGVTNVFITFPGSHLPTAAALVGHATLAAMLVVSAYFNLTRYALIGVAVLAAGAGIVPTLNFLPISLPGLPGADAPQEWEAIQCDVGQGSAFLARRSGRTVLVDVGPADGRISECMRHARIDHVDLLIISHFDADHVRGLGELLQVATIGEAWYSPNTHPDYNSEWALEALTRHGVNHRTVTVGESYESAPGEVLVEIVGPRIITGTADATNADSLVAVLSTESHRILALADAPYERQLTLTSVVADIDVVIAGHHGAADQSPELATQLAPRVTIFSVGENDYGHPTREALEIWHAPIVARTDECGPITLTGDHVIGCRSGMK